MVTLKAMMMTKTLNELREENTKSFELGEECAVGYANALNDIEESYQNLNLEVSKLKSEVEVLKNKNKNYKKQLSESNDSIIELQNNLLLKEGEYAKQYAKEYVKQLEEDYKEVQGFVKVVQNETELFDEIKKIIKVTNKQIVYDFMQNSLDVILEKYKEAFIHRANEYVNKENIDKSVENYVEKKMTSMMSKYKTNDLKELIKFVIGDVAKTQSLKLSKEILKEMSDMQVVQLQTITKCIDRINVRELSIENKYKDVRLLE
jgi:cell division GTPase FtsZ